MKRKENLELLQARFKMSHQHISQSTQDKALTFSPFLNVENKLADCLLTVSGVALCLAYLKSSCLEMALLVRGSMAYTCRSDLE